MTTVPAAGADRRAPEATGNLSGWLALAASPVFAAMAGIAAGNASPAPFCSAGQGVLPLDGMAAMYLLMSLFHLPPWLKLAARFSRNGTPPNRKENDHEPDRLP